MNLFGWFKKRPAEAGEPRSRMVCGTPYLDSGGILLLQTGNVVEIIRGTPQPPQAPKHQD